jgi:hypothetical protein
MRGRPRSLAPRTKTGRPTRAKQNRAVEERIDPSAYLLARRAAATGSPDICPDHPIDVLAGKGLLVEHWEDKQLASIRRSAAAKFAGLYWAVYGMPTAGIAQYDVTSTLGRSTATDPETVDDRYAAHLLRHQLRVLEQKGARVALVVTRVAALMHPIDAVAASPSFRSWQAALADLRQGLQALADTRPPPFDLDPATDRRR